MNRFKEFLIFKRLITPIALQVLFWAAIGGVLYGSWWLYTNGNWAWIMSLIFGILVSRLIFEALLVRYQTYVRLNEIKELLDKK